MEQRSELILESLDSVWFFSNIFFPPTTQLVHYHDGYPNKAQEEEEEKEEEEAKPISPLLTKNQQVESSSPSAHVVQPIKKKKSRRRKRRKRCNRKILGELELEFNGCDFWEFGDDAAAAADDQVVVEKEEECGHGLMFGRSQSGQKNYQMKDQKMPPLHDGLAMKEHLKSWAYAVACTVR